MVLNLRDIELSNQQAKLLVYAKEQRTLRESELQSQLDLEKERAAVSLAKQNNLHRALDAAEAKVAELSAGSGRLASKEGDLEHLLQLEREKVIVASAKYNTLKSKSEREVQELRKKLHELEGAVAAVQGVDPHQKPSRYTLSNTSQSTVCTVLLIFSTIHLSALQGLQCDDFDGAPFVLLSQRVPGPHRGLPCHHHSHKSAPPRVRRSPHPAPAPVPTQAVHLIRRL